MQKNNNRATLKIIKKWNSRVVPEQSRQQSSHRQHNTVQLISAEQPNQTLTGLQANCQVQCTAQWKQASKVVTDAKSCCLLRRNLTLCDRRFRWLKQSFCHWWELGRRSTSRIFSVTDHQTNKIWLIHNPPHPLQPPQLLWQWIENEEELEVTIVLLALDVDFSFRDLKMPLATKWCLFPNSWTLPEASPTCT